MRYSQKGFHTGSKKSRITRRGLTLSTAYRAVRNNRVSGKAAETAPEPGHPSIVPACPRKGCYRANGHHRGIHGRTTPAST